ncbi:MAG: hypothetical protein A2821_04270 [Candidatus Magasanikbacteria bacterium RIFCSPHIGHO2_01_FULL_41_23]|uniref:Uncharacterized protein n=1 Tax=Candidatus Magasanikbacteria bacterium RIFCSPLOWO2_01_FULL_40_15 TaxID=1798686 RepID=A0A1F6N4K4_9BACT|nr:MAG: hypothetical protein A2821_04270 [Candidatus Magasanikbacteria bacterium RIFCSPHIGHO2_01_FULL_41_23]OGH67142.1 MAG: hypothetical protein A3C66_02585 [Candidatus Magasanikbacteria bacterium RIFCSPHIGHO2_02_FULL_41_35]OGH76730.1 MAG: hypothetical protein A3F22_03445 [Candidatus Magasanikbacteria bacterium RIFCSPHIGHO2_12_FULL_41_16]OGH78678.1 MAG: hypothetical protein A2983_04220 [Candidatus Magasanikbacteria bacterium RIFCSPLOWO2_01_FULL_40_15]
MTTLTLVVYIDSRQFFCRDIGGLEHQPREGENITFWTEDDDPVHIGLVTKVQHVIGKLKFFVVYVRVEPAIYKKLPFNRSDWSKLLPSFVQIPDPV